MSIEDNNIEGIKLPTVQELPKEKKSFFGSLGDSISKNYEKSPFSSIVDTAVDTYNYFTGTESEKDNIKEKADISTGGYAGAIKDVFDNNIGVSLDDEENKHADAIAGFQKNLNNNIIQTTGLDELSIAGFHPFGFFNTDGIKFKKGDREEVQGLLNNIDNEPLPDNLQNRVNDYYTRYNTDLTNEINKTIAQEIKDKKILNDPDAIQSRKLELSKELKSEIDKDYEDELNTLTGSINDYKNTKKKLITDDYVESREGEDSLNTFNHNYSNNAATRTSQYIEENIVTPKMDEIMQNVSWTAKLSGDKVFSDMISKEQETLRRDYKYYYEQLALIKDPAKRAKMKGIMLPQIEAREKLFGGIIQNYENNINKIDNIVGLSDDDKQDIINNGYNVVTENLSDKDKKALLVRDGTDAVMSMYYNYEEMKKRWDQGGIIGTSAAVGNAIQVFLDGFSTIPGSIISGAASTSYKKTDKDKIFFDEYEMSTVADSLPMKGFKHVVYNVDDILEVLNLTNLTNKVNLPGKAIDATTKTLKSLSTGLRKAREGDLTKVSKLFNYTTDGGLTLSRVGLYALKGGTEGALINPLINRSLKISDTDANATADFLSDMLIEPFSYKALGQGKLATSSLALDSSIKGNSLVQNTLSYLMGEISPTDAVKQYLKDNPGMKKSDAYKLVRTARDTSYSLFDARLEDMFDGVKKTNQDSINNLYKTFADAYNKIKSGDPTQANKVLTTDGGVFKLDDLTTLKGNFENEIDNFIQLTKSDVESDVLFGNKAIDKKLNDIVKQVKGENVFQGATIKLSKEDKIIETRRFEDKIKTIKGITDPDRKQIELLSIMSDLIKLRNSNVNQAKKISSQLTLLNPMTNDTISLAYDDLNKLIDYNGGKENLNNFLTTGKLVINKENQSTLGTDGKIGTYSSVAVEGNLFKQIKKANSEALQIIIRGLTKSKDKTFGYSSMSKAYPYEQIDELKKVLDPLFGDNISYLDLGKTKAKSATSGTTSKKGRDDIADEMRSQEGKLVISYGEVETNGVKNTYYYVGAGKGISDLGFDISGKALDYHEKSAIILSDIMGQVTFEDGIDLARPLDNIKKYESITGEYKSKFMDDLLDEEDNNLKVKLTSNQRKERKQLVNKLFNRGKSDDDMFAKYIFEVIATKVIRNYGLFKKVEKDLSNLKAGKSVDENIIMKSIDDFNTVIKSVSGETITNKAGKVYKQQYDLGYFEKEASIKYDELVQHKLEAKLDLERKIDTLNKKVYTDSEKPFMDRQREFLQRKLDRANANKFSKDDFINKYVDSIYNNTFKRIYHTKTTELFSGIDGLVSKVDPKIKNQKKVGTIIKAKKDLKERIDSIDDAVKTDGLPKEKKNQLTEAKKTLKEQITKLDSELNKLKSVEQLDSDILKGNKKIPYNLKKFLEGIVKGKQTTLNEFYTILSNPAVTKYIEDTEGALDYILDKVANISKYNVSYDKNGIQLRTENGLFGKDAVSFITREQLNKGFRHLIDGSLDYKTALEENPYTKMFNTAFSGAGNTEEIRGLELFNKIKDFYGDGGDAQTLKELYFTSPKFKEFVKTLEVKKETDIEGSFNKFKSDMSSHFKGFDYNLHREDGTIVSAEKTKAELQSNKMYSELYKKIIGLKNLKNDGVIWKRVLTGYDKNGYAKFEFQKETGAIIEEKIFDKELKDNGLDGFRSVNIGKIDHLKYLKVIKKDKEVTINSILRKQLESRQKTHDSYSIGTDTLKYVLGIANGLVGTEHKENIRHQLGLEEGEYIMGTYGDKETSVQIYKSNAKTFAEAQEEFTKKYIKAGGFINEGDTISDIVKRESALASTKNMFGDIKKDTKTLILGEEIHSVKDGKRDIDAKSILVDIDNALEEKNIEFTQENINSFNFISDLKKLDDEFNEEFFYGKTIKDLKNVVSTTFKTDLFDGTSYMSNDLAELADYLEHGRKMKSDLARKFHYTGLIDGKRFLAKTLFNRADITYRNIEGETRGLKNTVLVGESSIKLGEYTKSNIKEVKVNGKTYKVIGEIKGTTTEGFKDAASDARVIKEDQALSEQIVNLMDYNILSEFKVEVLKEVEELYKNTMQGLGLHNEELSSFGDINIMLNNLSKITSLGGSSDSMINAKLKNFLDGYKQIISGNRDRGASHTILHSMVTISTDSNKYSDNLLNVPKSHFKGEPKRKLLKNEVIVSENSHIYKAAVEETNKQIDILTEEIANTDSWRGKLSQDLLDKEIEKKKAKLDFLNTSKEKGDYYITGIRNPIPNRENLGVYKIVTAEAVGLNRKDRVYVKNDDVILHPEATYMKIQGDNDGDHFVMFPIASNKSELVAKTAYGLGVDDNLYESIQSGRRNDFAIISQADPTEGEQQTLLKNRFKNLEAKLTISTGSSVIRGANIFLQYMQGLKDPANRKGILSLPITVMSNDPKRFGNVNITIKKALDNLVKYMGREPITNEADYSNIFVKGDSYGSDTGSVLQLIMDFAKDKSGKDFPRDEWVKKISNAVGIVDPKNKNGLGAVQYLFNNILSPLGSSHKSGDKKITLAGLGDNNWDTAITGSLGYRRGMYTAFKNKYKQNILNLKSSTEIGFMLDRMRNVFDNNIPLEKQFNTVIDTLKKDKTLFVSKDTKDKLEIIFDGLKNNTSDNKLLKETQDIMNEFDNLIEKYSTDESTRIDFMKVFNDMTINGEKIINNKGQLTKGIEKQRDILALYSLSKGNYSMFSLLTDGEKIDQLKFSQDFRYADKNTSITNYNSEAKPTIILAKDIPKSQKVSEFKDEIKILEDKKTKLESELNSYNDEQKEGLKELGEFEDSLIEQIDDINSDLNKVETSTTSKGTNVLKNNSTLRESIDDIDSAISVYKDHLKALNTDVEVIKAKEILSEEFGKNYQDEFLPSDYVDKLNVGYKMGQDTFKKLTDDFKIMGDVDTLIKEGTKIKLFSIFMSYDPDTASKVIYNRDTNINIGKAAREELVIIKNDLIKELKKLGVDKSMAMSASKELHKRIKQNLDKTEEGYKFNSEGYLSELKNNLDKNDLYSESDIESIMKAGKKFTTNIIPTIEKGLSNMDRYYKESGGYDIDKYPSKFSGSFLEDVLGSFVGDFEFEFRRRGIITKIGTSETRYAEPRAEFNKYMKKSAEDHGAKYNASHSNLLFEKFFVRKEDSKLLGIIKEVQAGYYFGAYQSASLVLGATGHISGLTQVLGNTIEMLAFLRKADLGELAEATKVIDKLNLHGEEASKTGQRLGESVGDDTFAQKVQSGISNKIKGIVGKILIKLGTKDTLLKEQLKNIIDTSISEPLLATDMLQDTIRGQAAMITMMQRYKVNNADELLNKLKTTNEKDTFRNLFYNEHNEMGGGVISNMDIFRDTTITNMFSQKGMGVGYASKVFFQLYKFLNGWSFHKLATGIEREMAGVHAIRLFMEGDNQGAKTMMKEFVDYNTAMMLNIGLATGIAVKLEKYDNKDEDDKTDIDGFIHSAVNQLAAMEILLDRELVNLQGVEGEDLSTRLKVTMIESLKHMTRIIRNNPFNFMVVGGTAAERRKILDEGLLESYYKAMRSTVGSYMRNAHGLILGNIYDGMKGQDTLSLLGYGVPTNYEQSISKLKQANAVGKIDSLGGFHSTADLLINMFTSKYIGNEEIQRGKERLLSDKDLIKLYDKGIGGAGYNLDTLLIDGNQLDQDTTESLWKKMIVYQGVGQQLDDKGRKTLTGHSELYNNKIDDIITQQLLNMGYTKDDFINRPTNRTIAMQKLFYESKQNNIPELSIPHITAYIANNQLTAIKKKWKEDNGLTYKTGFSFEEDQNAVFKYQVMKNLANEGILSANIMNVREILDEHVLKFMPKLDTQIKEAGANGGLKDYMTGLAISTRNLQEGETNASTLNKEYTKTFKGLLNYYNNNGKKVEPTAQAVEMVHNEVMNHIKHIVNSTADAKQQTTKLASLLYGMNNSTWNILKDDKVFNLLTSPAQKQLISWIYKTNVAIDDLDSNSISNYSVSNSSGYGKSSYFPNLFKNGMKSKYAGGARPGFKKQFPEMKNFLQGKQVPQYYNQIANSGLPRSGMSLNYLNFPIVRAMNQYFIRESFRAITQPAKAKVYIKKGSTKKGYLKTTKKKKNLPRYRKTSTGGKSTIRKTTLKGLPGDITSN